MHERLDRNGVDLAGYTLAEQADDIDAARVALGYRRIDLVSDNKDIRLAFVYTPGGTRTMSSAGRSVRVNPPGNFLPGGSRHR